MTPYGVRTQIPLLPVNKVFPRSALAPNSDRDKSYSNVYFALLACEPSARPGHIMSIVCVLERARTGPSFTVATGGTWSVVKSAAECERHARAHTAFRVTALPPELLKRCLAHLSAEMLYVPLEDPRRLRVARPIWRQTEIRLAGWSAAILRELGYIVEGGRVRPRVHRYTLAKGEDAVGVEFEYSDTSEPGWSTEILVVVSPLPGPARSSPGGGGTNARSASTRRRSARLGSRSPEDAPAASSSKRLRLGEYYDAKECRLLLSSGRYLTLLFMVHRISSVLGYLDVQVLGEGGRDSMSTTYSGSASGTMTHATGRSPSEASVSAVASARVGAPLAEADEYSEGGVVDQFELVEVPEIDLEAEEEMSSPAVSASSFKFLDEVEGRHSPT
ncbi:hypothetical protein DICSQDRAFT_128028 [Dichomitus squalens LYAD-421 SS1]|uniref:DUF8212 domain-containing protein n=1 Tax=Dichomitus squalens (strain LYAD-421) TaxID=732165 RepID=R7SY42_DICSQ|nr:uncharacterized protein DICSQDRAFT_128028 [Dichomitus squalens LYAD-421 SS1]EJF59902.1 hypothetical protein DICSQDRAFT_128028 [Dichomitus squalens LYAD-421 SS1]